MKKLSFHIISLFLFGSGFLFAQGEGAVPFLRMPVSPAQSAMGLTGASLPSDDPFGFLFNPAQLGFTSQTNNLSFVFYPSEINWLNWGFVDVNGLALNLGYNFKDLTGIPLSVGLGYSNQEMIFGYQSLPIFTKDAKDSYDAYSIGAGIDYFVQFYAGVTLKSISSVLSQSVMENQVTGKIETTAIDYGFLLNMPVLKYIDDELSFNLIRDVADKPYFNLSLGMSKSNIGDEVYYIDEAQSDPLPRMVRFGYGISTGVDFYIENNPINVIDIAFTIDAEDILIERTESGNMSYQSGLGDIDLGKHVFQIEGDDKVISRAGLQISLMETLVIRRGHFSSTAYHMKKTNGYEFRTKGIFKLFNKYSGGPVISYIADHIDLRYYNARLFAGDFLGTDIEGIALVVSGVEF